VKEYEQVAESLNGAQGVAAIEVNISCPNVDLGGMAFGTSPREAAVVTNAVVRRSHLPVIVKLSPNVTDIQQIAKAVEEAGAKAVSLINTVTGMAVDIVTRKPKLSNVTGGLSGPAIKPIALHMVHQVSMAVSIPVIGIGGIMNYRDALEFIIAGAYAVQVGTANFVNPHATVEILEGLENHFKANSISCTEDLIGTLDTSREVETIIPSA
jgi:dihydroorotate dehydrogenase (NAD+) catalytic subunit